MTGSMIPTVIGGIEIKFVVLAMHGKARYTDGNV